ncbi:39S ribosomal protein L40, mitochondrial [Homalodisca vitripennis]|nr:39S ribosomal protein L40, mitochondrial [Homalodisca vitripennis]
MNAGEPLKKKKRLDPAIIRAREEKKKKKLEKQIRRLEKNARQSKPIDECEVPTVLIEPEEEKIITMTKDVSLSTLVSQRPEQVCECQAVVGILGEDGITVVEGGRLRSRSMRKNYGTASQSHVSPEEGEASSEPSSPVKKTTKSVYKREDFSISKYKHLEYSAERPEYVVARPFIDSIVSGTFQFKKSGPVNLPSTKAYHGMLLVKAKKVLEFQNTVHYVTEDHLTFYQKILTWDQSIPLEGNVVEENKSNVSLCMCTRWSRVDDQNTRVRVDLIRKRKIPPLTSAQVDERVWLTKDWTRYRYQQAIGDISLVERLAYSQARALNELRQESEELYQEAIQIDPALLPFVVQGPVVTPPIPDYESPDGEYVDITKKWT